MTTADVDRWVTTNLHGFHGDCSETFVIGAATAEATRLVEVARRSRDLGVAMIRPALRVGDIGAAIADYVRAQGCSKHAPALGAANAITV